MRRAFVLAWSVPLALACGAQAGAQDSVHTADRLVRVSRAWPVMGTMLVVTAWTTDSARGVTALLAARDSVRLVDSLMSVYRETSDLARVNRDAGGPEPVHVASHTMAVLRDARRYWRVSAGAFDPTIGPIVKAWELEGGRGRRPGARERDSLQRLVDFGSVELDSARSTVRLPRPGMRLDLGGIAKGYALDLARAALRDPTIRGGSVNLGGNVLLFGHPPDGDRWVVQIVDPLRRGRSIGRVSIDSGAVATSGQYEHYVVVRGQRYGHLLDPRTGQPARGILSATAIGPTGAWSDGLSATLFLLGARRGARLVDSLPDVAGVWVVDRGQSRTERRDVVCSRRMTGRFTLDSSLRAAPRRARTRHSVSPAVSGWCGSSGG